MSSASAQQKDHASALSHQPNNRKTKLSPAVITRLLDLLSSDDEFRSLFQSDPMGALIRAGHDPSREADRANEVQFFPGLYCYLVGELASKEEIAATRDLISSYLMSESNHQVIYAFEAGKVATTLTRKAI